MRNDFIVVHGKTRPMKIPLERARLSWPPPESLVFNDEGRLEEYDPLRHPAELLMERVAMTTYTDEQMRLLPPWTERIAEYRYVI